jgi:iron complex transport system permease protein
VRRDPVRSLVVFGVLALGSALLHLTIAREDPGPLRALSGLFAWLAGTAPTDAMDAFVVGEVRVPRLLVAVFGGASLAVAGAVMQAVFRNPLASPDIIGTSAGAAFGGALALAMNWVSLSMLVSPVASLAGAMAVTGAVFALARVGTRFSTTGLLLAGVAMNTLIGALTTFVVKFTFDNYAASSRVLHWLMGGLEARNWWHVAITTGGFVLFAGLLSGRARELDLLTLRDDSAHSLGIDPHRARRWLVWLACGLTATTVSNTGGIVFVALVVPHLARLLIGPAHRYLLPASALLGATLLVFSDWLCRIAPADLDLPLSVVTAGLGAPFFLFLLRRLRRGEELACVCWVGDCTCAAGRGRFSPASTSICAPASWSCSVVATAPARVRCCEYCSAPSRLLAAKSCWRRDRWRAGRHANARARWRSCRRIQTRRSNSRVVNSWPWAGTRIEAQRRCSPRTCARSRTHSMRSTPSASPIARSPRCRVANSGASRWLARWQPRQA